jgi:hypothetical protein
LYASQDNRDILRLKRQVSDSGEESEESSSSESTTPSVPWSEEYGISEPFEEVVSSIPYSPGYQSSFAPGNGIGVDARRFVVLRELQGKYAKAGDARRLESLRRLLSRLQHLKEFLEERFNGLDLSGSGSLGSDVEEIKGKSDVIVSNLSSVISSLQEMANEDDVAEAERAAFYASQESFRNQVQQKFSEVQNNHAMSHQQVMAMLNVLKNRQGILYQYLWEKNDFIRKQIIAAIMYYFNHFHMPTLPPPVIGDPPSATLPP